MNPYDVLAVMLALPTFYGDRGETFDQRYKLLEPLAFEIVSAAGGSRWRASLLVTTAYAETRLARFVIEGRCEEGPVGMRCDYSHKLKRSLSRGVFQLKEESCRAAYQYPAGSRESLREEARCAIRQLGAAKKRCAGVHPAGDLAGMFSGYGGNSCIWPAAAERAKRVPVIESRLSILAAASR